MPTGKVKFFDSEKGFGFVSTDDPADGGDVFVPSSALPEGVTALKNGARIEFGIVEGRRGAQALSVRLLEPAASVTTNRKVRDRKPAEDILAAGAREVKTNAELARASDIVILCVTGSPQIEEIVYGPDGILGAARDGLIDTEAWRVNLREYHPVARFGASFYTRTNDRFSLSDTAGQLAPTSTVIDES